MCQNSSSNLRDLVKRTLDLSLCNYFSMVMSRFTISQVDNLSIPCKKTQRTAERDGIVYDGLAASIWTASKTNYFQLSLPLRMLYIQLSEGNFKSQSTPYLYISLYVPWSVRQEIFVSPFSTKIAFIEERTPKKILPVSRSCVHGLKIRRGLKQ